MVGVYSREGKGGRRGYLSAAAGLLRWDLLIGAIVGSLYLHRASRLFLATAILLSYFPSPTACCSFDVQLPLLPLQVRKPRVLLLDEATRWVSLFFEKKNPPDNKHSHCIFCGLFSCCATEALFRVAVEIQQRTVPTVV